MHGCSIFGRLPVIPHSIRDEGSDFYCFYIQMLRRVYNSYVSIYGILLNIIFVNL